jgi:tetratricopeptide (TPR) repeat protein/SAM-dependent methyltransferase
MESIMTNAESLQQTGPSPQEIYALAALFTEGRYPEAATLAQTMTLRFPLHEFGWKVLGAVFKQMGRSADALAPMQKAVVLSPSDAEACSNLGLTLMDLGRRDEAEGSYRRALQIKPDYAEAHFNLGITLKELGRLDESAASFRRALQIKPDFSEAHYNLGITLMDLGRRDEAEASYRRALQIKPDYAEAHSNLGITLMDLGRLDESEASYRRALQIKPDLAETHCNLGNALMGLGRPDEAEASYRRALQIKPDYAEAQSNLGITLMDLGRLEESEASYRRALQIKPDYVEAHCNLGVTLMDLGRLDEAEASYRRALEIKPDFVDALNNLALLFNAQGKAMLAFDTVKQSLQIRETGEARRIFVACVKHLRFTHDDREIRAAMVRALTEPWGRPSDLARIGIDLVKLKPDIGECVARAAAWPLRLSAQDLFGPNGPKTTAADPLLCALLDSAPICDIDMERFLTMARRAMLEAATRMTVSGGEVGAVMSFYSALARQCFINEYVFAHTDNEIREAGDLRDSLAAALEAKTQAPILWPIAVAAYFPLCSLPFASRLLDGQWPEQVAAVLVQQVREPADELRIRATIPRLTDIEDRVSLLVQNQYEDNPYPRWIKAAPAGKARNIVGHLRQMFPLASFNRRLMSGSVDILIAGCGTGQHSIETARQFQGTRVLAIDLSIGSLSYAKRKTHELGLTSVEYAQADLLKLGSLGRSFDIIESSGVLHHLADPLLGWQVLLSLLRPGGFMRLGFYSEVARRYIVKARAFIAEHGYGSTADEIRRCRQDLVELEKSADLGTTLKSPDFFSISACRDLLFHVQEHRMTLTGIDAFLRDNNLAFLGFEIDDDVLRAYKLRFPDDHAATNLGQWQIFENENPDTFLGMYNFWVQKVG